MGTSQYLVIDDPYAIGTRNKNLISEFLFYHSKNSMQLNIGTLKVFLQHHTTNYSQCTHFANFQDAKNPLRKRPILRKEPDLPEKLRKGPVGEISHKV